MTNEEDMTEEEKAAAIAKEEADEDAEYERVTRRTEERQLSLPRSQCCEIARTAYTYNNDPLLHFWVAPGDDEEAFDDSGLPEGLRRPRGRHGWQIDGIGGFVKFCPWCGAKLPEMERTRTDAKICVVKDGGYYCDTCEERLQNCLCDFPAVEWTPVKSPA